MPKAIEGFDLTGYDLVISSSWAFAHGVITKPPTVHLAYIHSPMRWAWDMEDEYMQQSNLPRWAKRLARDQLQHLRKWDVRAGSRPTSLIANSQFVAERIRNYWGKECAVIYPPVSVPEHPLDESRGTYHGSYISVSRLVQYKRIELLIRAFEFLPDRELIVVGDGPEYGYLQSIAGRNIRFTRRISDSEVKHLVSGARGFLQASKEDFGISLVEAQACGVPVLAYATGGASEIVQNYGSSRPTGALFSELEPRKIADSVQAFERIKFNSDDCKTNAKRFAPIHFKQQLIHHLMKLGLR